MADIFLSYAKEDVDRARALARALETCGWSVWWDHKIPPGRTWVSLIKEKLDESRCVVALWSAASVDSEWVAKEARYAQRRGALVPARIDDSEPPFEFDHIHAADLIGWDGEPSVEGFTDLREAIESQIGGAQGPPSPGPGVVDQAPFPPRRSARRRSRVSITYELEARGTRHQVELPFVVGVLADLAGDGGAELPHLGNRRFEEITADTFDRVLRRVGAALEYKVDNQLDPAVDGEIEIRLGFESLDDFSPEVVAERVGPTRELLVRRDSLVHLKRSLRTNNKLHDAILKALEEDLEGHDAAREDLIARIAETGFRTEEGRQRRRDAIHYFLTALTEGSIAPGEAPDAAVDELIAQLDARLSAQLNEIMHAPKFQKLESAWRGLRYLVSRTEAGELLQIRVMSVSKDELASDLTGGRAEMAVDRSHLFGQIYQAAFNQFGGTPYGVLIGDHAFAQTAEDVRLLTRISQLAAAAHVPFIAGADPDMFGFESFADFRGVDRLDSRFEGPEYAAWNAFRDTEDARFVFLTLPRLLIREPYGKDTTPVQAFDFDEGVSAAGGPRYLWANAAWGLGACITRAFAAYGWCARIRGSRTGGRVEGLPVHTFHTTGADTVLKCPTEALIPDSQEFELSSLGFVPLANERNTLRATFFSVRSVHRPKEFVGDGGDAATANAQLAAQLPYLFAISRFAHYLKVIVRDRIGAVTRRRDRSELLNDWIGQYVLKSESATEEAKARMPLRSAEVRVDENPRRPGTYQAIAFLQPHYQLDVPGFSTRVVIDLP